MRGLTDPLYILKLHTLSAGSSSSRGTRVTDLTLLLVASLAKVNRFAKVVTIGFSLRFARVILGLSKLLRFTARQ